MLLGVGELDGVRLPGDRTVGYMGVTAVFLTQLLPSSTLPVRSQLRQLVYQALVG